MCSTSGRLLLVFFALQSCCGLCLAQNTYLWNAANAVNGTGGSNGAWIRNGPSVNVPGHHWVNQTGSSLTIPGVTSNSSVTVNGNVRDVATFNLAGTLPIQISMNNSTNSGNNSNSSANGLLSLGAIANLSTAVQSLSISASTAALNPPGIIQLNGAYAANTVGLTATTIVSASGGDITFTRGIGSLLDVRLGIDQGVISVATGRNVTFSSFLNDGGNSRGFVKNGLGTLLFNGTNSNTGNNIVNAGALGGNGTITGKTTVNNGGQIHGGSGSNTGTLNVSNVTINSGGTMFANLGESGTNSTLAFAGNTLDLKTESVLRLDDVTGYGYGTFLLATFTNGNTLQLDAIGNRPDGFVFGTYQQGVGASGPVVIDVSNLPTLTAGDKLTLQRSGNNLALTFTPVPEPAFVLGAFLLPGGVVAGLRTLLRRAKPAALTPAA